MAKTAKTKSEEWYKRNKGSFFPITLKGEIAKLLIAHCWQNKVSKQKTSVKIIEDFFHAIPERKRKSLLATYASMTPNQRQSPIKELRKIKEPEIIIVKDKKGEKIEAYFHKPIKGELPETVCHKIYAVSHKDYITQVNAFEKSEGIIYKGHQCLTEKGKKFFKD